MVRAKIKSALSEEQTADSTVQCCFPQAMASARIRHICVQESREGPATGKMPLP